VSALPCIGREELFQPSGELVAFGRRQPAQSKPVLEAWGVAKTLCGTCSRVEACLRAELAAMRAGARTMGVHGGTDPRERAAMLDPLEEPAPLAADCGTVGGYHAHRRRGEGACDDCRAAIAKYNAERKAVLRATEGARTA
jgi:hypothetical protein